MTETLNPNDSAASGAAKLSIVVLASGSGTLLQSILDHQEDEGSRYQVVKVIADKQCQALERAGKRGIDTEIVALEEDRNEWNIRLASALSACGPDFVVSAGFMKILGEPVLDEFEGRIINTHPALLPSFPGAHAVRDALAYGVKVTGSTVHFIDAGVDTGPIIAQRPVVVEEGDDEATLHERIKKVERELVVEVLNSMPQPHS